MAEKLNVGIISLGCDKNRVDTELMLGVLSDKNYNIVSSESDADIIIVNTCGFIESAKQESINTILELSNNKQVGRCKVLIAAGCLAERYSDELLNEITELDAVVGVGNYMEIDSVIKKILQGHKNVNSTGNINFDIDFNSKRVITTPSYTAYVKIAEGCNNCCSYCIIPKLRGSYRSRSVENIINEVKYFAENGTKEIILIAQDTSKYGIDIYGSKKLPDLINELSKINSIEWIRLLYCYPEDIDDNLINVIQSNNKVCKYIDIPIQHINNTLLKNMGRTSRREDIENLLLKLREKIPEIVIRTSLIVGFPGETEEQFLELLSFLNDFEIDRVGIFTYSQEEGTSAALLENQIDDKIKKVRQRKLAVLQKKISLSKNKSRINKIYRVLIEEIKADGTSVGRTYGDAPEIDGVVYIKDTVSYLNIGDYVNVKIVDALDYDLVGEIDYESCK